MSYLYVQTNIIFKLTKKCNTLHFNSCLFFVANELSRLISEMAEEEFMFAGLSPSYAFVLSIVINEPGITPHEISDILKLKPSTITRLLDKLEYQGLIERSNEGRSVLVSPTEKGFALEKSIRQAWTNLFQRYTKILGEEDSINLTSNIYKACETILYNNYQNKIKESL